MRRSIRAALLVALLGCVSAPPAPSPHRPHFTQDRGFASAEECGQVADHLFTISLHGTSKNVPEEHLLYGSQKEYRSRYNAFVASCTTKLTHKDAACVLDAPGFQYVKECEITEGTTDLLPLWPTSPEISRDF